MRAARHRTLLLAAVAAAVTLAGCSSGSGGTDGTLTAGGGGGDSAVGAQAMPAAAAETTTSTPANGITVEGAGRVTGRPDTLTATVGVEVERPEVQAALDAANAGIQRVIDAVTGAGVAEEDVQTTQFDVHPRYEQQPGQDQPVIRGYLVSNLVEVTIRDVDTAGDVLGVATEAGGEDARVQGIRFSLEDNQQLVEQARQQAFADARARAEQYAELAGRPLGQLVSIDETFQPPVPSEQFALESVADAEGGARVPIQAGQQEVEVRVTTVWSLG